MVTYPDLSHRYILVADRNLDVMERTAEHLEKEGGEIDTLILGDGNDSHVVDRIISGEPDVVITENLSSESYERFNQPLPDEDGPLRILYTGTDDAGALKLAQSKGFRIIGKDCSPEEILDRVDRELMEKRYRHMTKEDIPSLRHDLKSPLNVIGGRAELIQNAENLGDAKESARAISKSTGQMERIISRISTPYELELQKVEIFNEIRGCVEQFSNRTDIEVSTYLPDSGMNIIADPEIGRAVDNLLSNARKHGKATEIAVIGWSDEDDVYFSVEDNGEGMPEYGDIDPYQARSKGENSSGTGLGLYIADHVMKNSYGRLTDEPSDRLGGAQFIGNLPRELPERAQT